MDIVGQMKTGGVLAALLATTACAGSPMQVTTRPPTLDALPRSLTVAETKVRDAANGFSFALWGALNAAQRDVNVFISPLSASFALGMTMNGAASQTYSEMRAALQLGGASLAEIDGGYKSLVALLIGLDPTVQIQVANSIWYRQEFPFRQSFLDSTKTYFDATVRGLNFGDAPGSLATINGWVNTATNGKIPAVLTELRSDQVMFLINVIYFNGKWRTPFDPAETNTATFTGAGGTTQGVQLMHRLDTLSYVETATYQAADLPYGNAAFTMTVLLPKAVTSIETLAAALTPAAWQAIVTGFRTTKIDFSLPKLKLSYERRLNDDLKALGMVVPFNAGGADFTQMAAAPVGNQLFIDFVKQNTFVDVNEAGTEAAAATTVGIGVTSAPVLPIMRVDRPYLFVLRERLSGTVLFMGKIVRMPAS